MSNNERTIKNEARGLEGTQKITVVPKSRANSDDNIFIKMLFILNLPKVVLSPKKLIRKVVNCSFQKF